MDKCLYVHSSSYTGVKIRIIIIRIIRPLYHARLQNKKGFSVVMWAEVLLFNVWVLIMG